MLVKKYEIFTGLMGSFCLLLSLKKSRVVSRWTSMSTTLYEGSKGRDVGRLLFDFDKERPWSLAFFLALSLLTFSWRPSIIIVTSSMQSLARSHGFVSKPEQKRNKYAFRFIVEVDMVRGIINLLL